MALGIQRIVNSVIIWNPCVENEGQGGEKRKKYRKNPDLRQPPVISNFS